VATVVTANHVGVGIYCLDFAGRSDRGSGLDRRGLGGLSDGLYVDLERDGERFLLDRTSNVLVTSYSGPGGPLTNESWYGFFF
jgi:hypothetical protein